MILLRPIRGELIAVLPIFQRINPLPRPRLNYFTKTIYQPKENQKALLGDIQNFESMEIAFPVIVDTVINFEAKPGAKPPIAIRFGDEDNLRKAICDALTFGKIMVDDRWIVGGENYKWNGSEDCCLVKIYSLEGEEEIGL